MKKIKDTFLYNLWKHILQYLLAIVILLWIFHDMDCSGNKTTHLKKDKTMQNLTSKETNALQGTLSKLQHQRLTLERLQNGAENKGNFTIRVLHNGGEVHTQTKFNIPGDSARDLNNNEPNQSFKTITSNYVQDLIIQTEKNIDNTNKDIRLLVRNAGTLSSKKDTPVEPDDLV